MKIKMPKVKLPKAVTTRYHRNKLVLRKNAPHIAFGLGVAGAVGATVLACRATLRLPDTLDEVEKELNEAKDLKDAVEGAMIEEDYRRLLSMTYVKSGVKVAKLYAPAAGVGIISIGLLTGSHIDMSRRNTALMAAYATVSKALEDYRERVTDELGKDRELEIYRNLSTPEDEDGDGPLLRKIHDPNNLSGHARFFDEASPHWEKNAELNMIFVRCQQNYANDLLQARGHLFLNEVYDMLGFERSSAGSVVGWVIGKGEDHPGDNYIDFGIFQPPNAAFVEGTERSVLLDFNVDGVIFDKI